ncbi:MAG: hypothetical protein ACN2B6_06255 [Rickettsiales bacterium]
MLVSLLKKSLIATLLLCATTSAHANTKLLGEMNDKKHAKMKAETKKKADAEVERVKSGPTIRDHPDGTLVTNNARLRTGARTDVLATPPIGSME